MGEDYDGVGLEHDGLLSIVTLDRPEKLNAFDTTMTYGLIDRLREADRYEGTGAIVLTGAGRAFSAGGNIENMGRAQTPRVNHRDWELAHAILAVEKPLVAMVNGPAIGLGLTVALLCDCVIAADDAKMGDTHVSFGLVAGDGAAIVIPLLVGPQRAKELLMRARVFTGREAADMGLVNQAVPAGELVATTRAFAEELASQPAYAVRATKMIVNRYVRAMAQEVLDAALAWEQISMRLPEHAEAVQRWKDARAPREAT